MLTALFLTAIAFAQDVPPPAVPVIVVSTAPLAPADLNSPYASPRDAARHRLQVTLSDLAANRNLKDGMRGFAQAFLDDPAYARAAFDLGILAAIAEKWDDAVAALDQASRLDPALGSIAAAQLERLRLIAKLEKSADGQRTRAYDETLLPLLERLPGMQPADATAALAALGRIDPGRWEAPALLAGINGDGSGYQVASKFLEIAVAGSTDPTLKQALQTARAAAERELQYSSTRSAAEAASDVGDYAKAAELYQSAWKTIPARVETGMDAASALLLCDDTRHASVLLVRLRQSGSGASEPAGVMLKELGQIEPEAGPAPGDAEAFFRDPGPHDPVRIATLIPPMDRKPFEIYRRPVPRLVDDAEPVVLLASLAVDASGSAPLPGLPAASIAGENPWREIAASRSRLDVAQPRAVQTVDLSSNSPDARVVQVTTQPQGARIFVGAAADAACESPCNLRMAPGEYQMRLSLSGYRDAVETVQVKSEVQDLPVALELLRGSILIEGANPASIIVNGSAAGAETSPVELSLSPGLYRIGADFGSGVRERLLNIKPGARLRFAPGIFNR